jgi:hypothetical protein
MGKVKISLEQQSFIRIKSCWAILLIWLTLIHFHHQGGVDDGETLLEQR